MNFNYRVFIVWVLTLFVLEANAQSPSPEKKETPVHEKKVFIEDGKIYWNKSLPVYLFVSTKEDGSDMMKLESKSTSKYANPMYFDTEGINYIRHKWAVDPETGEVMQDVEVEFEVYNDGLPPISESLVTGENRYSSGGKVYYGKNVKVELSAKDGVSGLDGIYQVVNGSQFQPYSSVLNLESDGEYNVQYYSVDKVGNVEKIKSRKLTVDLTPPVTNHVVEGKRVDDVLSPKTSISFEKADNASGVKRTIYSFNGESEKAYFGKVYLSSLSDGEHTIDYYSDDYVGNKETKKSYSFYLDKTPPRVVSLVQGDRFNNRGRNYISGRSKLKLVANDNKSGVDKVYYRINGGEAKEYTEPFPLQRSQGNMVVSFYATDKVGNTGGAVTDRNLGNMYLDLTAPNISYAVTGPKLFSRDTMFVNDKSKIRLIASDGESGIQKINYNLDSKGETEYNEPFSVSGSNGVHKFSYSAIDQVYNQQVKEDFVVLDTEGPEVFFHPSIEKIATQKYQKDNKEIPVYTTATQFYLAATDKLVGADKIYYKLDKNREKQYGTAIEISKRGNRKLTIWAVDKLGNKSDETTYDFVIQ